MILQKRRARHRDREAGGNNEQHFCKIIQPAATYRVSCKMALQ
jgi:hypothetical protein